MLIFNKMREMIFFFTLFPFFINAQISGNITYEISFNDKIVDTSNLSKKYKNHKKYKQIRSYTSKILKSNQSVKGILKFSKNESVYSLEKAIKNEAEKGINLTRVLAGKKETNYFNTKDSINLVQKKIMDDFFLIKTPLHKWNITQKTKKIGKYICYKAITKVSNHNKKIITVWFTPQIPVRFGPKQFNGLPGLVLEVNYHTLIYKAYQIKLSSKKIKIQKPKKGQNINEKEYKKLLKEYFPNFFENR